MCDAGDTSNVFQQYQANLSDINAIINSTCHSTNMSTGMFPYGASFAHALLQNNLREHTCMYLCHHLRQANTSKNLQLTYSLSLSDHVDSSIKIFLTILVFDEARKLSSSDANDVTLIINFERILSSPAYVDCRSHFVLTDTRCPGSFS